MTTTSNSVGQLGWLWRFGSSWLSRSIIIAVLALFVASSIRANNRRDDQGNSITEPPTFVSLEKFQVFDKIYDENHYSKFGHLLLKDEFGSKMQEIRENNRYVQNINREICRQWLSGNGRQPVTWSTLISVIHETGLHRLAAEINTNIAPTIFHVHAKTSRLIEESPIQKPPSLKLLESLHFFHKVYNKNYYSAFGILLLEDSHGKAMEMITSKVHDVQNINREICKRWLQRKGKQPVTWTTFIDTVHKIGLRRVANEMFTSVDPDYLDVESHLVYTHPSVLNAINPIKQKYLNQPLFLNKFEVTSNVIYLNVSMVNIDVHRNKGEQYDLWKQLNERNSSKILVTGHPGAGKTTFVRYLAKLWANESDLEFCQVLFYLTLNTNDVERITSLESLLNKSSYPLKDKGIIAEEITNEQGAGTCFLLDSYEWTYYYDESDYVYKILIGEVLTQSLRIITARPNELAYRIPSIVHLEMVGFNKDDLPNYLEKVSNNQSLINEVKNLWDKQPHVKELCTLPLLFSMVLSIIGAKDYDSEILLETRTQIYTVFMFNTIFQYKIKRPYYFIQGCLNHSESHITKVQPCPAFKALLNVAFSITFDGERSFLDTQSDETLEMIKNLGIVSTKLNRYKYRRIFTFSHSTYGEFFAALHLTTLPLETQLHYCTLYTHTWFSAFQFFFGIQSALYPRDTNSISSVFQKLSIHYSTKVWHISEPCTFQFHVKLFEFLQEYVKSDMKLQDIDEDSLLYKTGMVVNSSLCVYSESYQYSYVFNNKNVHRIHYSESTNATSLTIENWNYNIQEEDLKLVNDGIWGISESDTFPELNSLSLSIWNSDDHTTLTYLLSASSNLHTIHLNLFPISFDYDLLAKILDNPALTCLNDLSLSGLPMNYSELSYITGESGLIPCITGLTLIGKQFYGEVEQSFRDSGYEFIQSMWQKVVSLFWQHPTVLQTRKHYDPCTMMSLKDILKDPGRLKWFKIKGASLFQGCTNYINFTSLLIGLQGLRHLYITEVNISKGGLGMFLKNSLLASNLHTLEISRFHMNTNEIANVLQNLPYASNIHSLTLDNINLTDHGVHVLSKVLKNLTSLHSLSLGGNKITSEGLHILITSLRNHLTLHSLDLSYNTKIFEKKTGLEALTHLSHIQDLNLIGCKVNLRDKSWFLRIFSRLTTLESLSLCKDHDVGYWEKASKVEFAKELHHLTQLKHFHAWDCFLKPS